jgi:hypothetical protein
VVNVNLTLNNQLPIELVNVTGRGAGNGQTVDTAFWPVLGKTCEASCSFSGNVTIKGIYTSANPINLALTIVAKRTVAWGFPSLWFRIGTEQETIDVPLEILPSNGTVHLSGQ